MKPINRRKGKRENIKTRRQENKKTRKQYLVFPSHLSLLSPSPFRLLTPYSLLLAFILLFPALAQETSETLQNLDQYIQNSEAKLLEYQQQISAIEIELGSMAGDFEAQIAQRDAINAEIQELRRKNDILREQIAQSRAELAATEEKFAKLGDTINQLRSRVQELLISVYKDPSNRFASMLSKAESFHDLRVKQYFLSLLSSHHVQMINDLNSAVLELNALQEQQSQIVATLDAQITEHEIGEALLASKRKDVEAIIAELDSTREGRLATQQALFQEAARLEDAIGDLERDRQAEIERLKAEAEAKRKAALTATTQTEQAQLNREASDAESRASNLAAPPPNLNPNYVSPLDSLSVEFPFGEVGKFIVLRAATSGAAVKAVQPGNIIQVSPISANDGYIVVIQHAGGLTTAYVNLQENPPVQIGQQVAQGAVIGYVGGGLQPDILKFFTRVEKNGIGTYVDPAELLGL
jgi:murein DD-endopeptidase MepM/ murein hydrolase activator NlpD